MRAGRFARLSLALASLVCLTAASPENRPSPFLSLQALRQAYGDPAGRIARIRGVEVYYKDEGRGPVLLLVHGSACSQHSWDDVAALLTPQYRIIRYDIPGQGLSGPVSDDVATHALPEEIAEDLLARLGVKHATVIGFSSGGTLAVALAAHRPDLVDRLILSNAPADPVVTSHLQVSPALESAQAAAKAAGFQDQAFWNAFLDFFSADGRRITLATRRQFYDMNRRVPEPNAISLVAKVADHARAVQAMADVRAPTLLIWGDTDRLLPPAAAKILRDYLKSSTVSEMIMSDVGHYPPIEAPARFAQIARAFIEAASSPER